MRFILVLVVGLFAWAGESWAFDGNDLKRDCFDSENSFSAGYCLGFINGVADYLIEKEHKICLQEGITQEQTKEIVKRFLSDNPALLHSRAALLVWLALSEAFTCN